MLENNHDIQIFIFIKLAYFFQGKNNLLTNVSYCFKHITEISHVEVPRHQVSWHISWCFSDENKMLLYFTVSYSFNFLSIYGF